MSTHDDVKAQAASAFGQHAQNYVASAVHRGGHDLDRMVELTQPGSDWRALDVATGGGHTALKFAPQVGSVVASDLSPAMLAAARDHISTQNVTNIDYCANDAENLPFAANSFDLVLCRVAAHHFPDAFRFVRESARVLKPGGVLLVHDHLLPDDKRDIEYIEAFERLRDPSHHRAFTEYEWRGMFLDADLTVEHTEQQSRSDNMVAWAERIGCTPDVIERLHIMLVQAPTGVAEWVKPVAVNSPDAAFDHVYIIIMGKKR